MVLGRGFRTERADDLPELDDDLLIIAGIVHDFRARPNLPGRHPSPWPMILTYIPEGFTEDDRISLFVYDGESGVWLQVDFEVIETGVIRFSTAIRIRLRAWNLPTVDYGLTHP